MSVPAPAPSPTVPNKSLNVTPKTFGAISVAANTELYIASASAAVVIVPAAIALSTAASAALCASASVAPSNVPRYFNPALASCI